MKTNSFRGHEKTAVVKKSPGFIFRLFEQDGSSRLLDKKIDGVHMLSNYFLKLTLEANNFPQSKSGIALFVDAVLSNDVNEGINVEEAIQPLAEAVAAAFNVEVDGKNAPLNIRTKRQIVYGLKKEIEQALVAEKRL